MVIYLLKCQENGNNFILIDEISCDYNFSELQRKDIAKQLCNRKISIGADGILYVLRSEKYDAKMRIFNSDGSEAETCGNGLACVGRYVMNILKKDNTIIETQKAKYMIKRADDIYEGVNTVEIAIDTIEFNVKVLPMNYMKEMLLFDKIEELSEVHDFSAVSIMSPHIVSIVDDIDIFNLTSIGKKANSLPEIFPMGVNVNFVKVIDKNIIYVKTYERGAKSRKSCGAGMIASSVISSLSYYAELGKEIKIFNDGGMVKCIVNRSDKGKYTVRLIDDATFEFEGTLSIEGDNVIQNMKFNEKTVKTFTEEREKYDKFFEYTQKVINK